MNPWWYLLTRVARNRWRALQGRLRSPRYAIALVVGVGYLALVIWSHRGGADRPATGDGMVLAGATLLALLAAKWWLIGADRLALAFSPAEVQFLFPAPLSRASLLGYKLLRAQLLIVLNVFIWMALLRKDVPPGLPTPLHGLALWAAFTTMFLHRLAAALTRDAVTGHGRSGLARHWPSVVILGVLAAVVISSAQRAATTLPDLGSGQGGPIGTLVATLEAPPLSWVLFPFTIPFLPLAAGSAIAWVPRFLAALGLVALHLLWVVRADHAFEESAIEASARRAELLERWRRRGTGSQRPTGKARRWVRLATTGSPLTAVIWKNCTRLVRTSSPMVLGMSALLVVVIGGYTATSGDSGNRVNTLIGTMALGWAGMLALLGPQWVRIDLRGDLDHLPLLRTWPLTGAQLMTAEVLSSTLVLTGVQATVLLLGLLALAQTGTPFVASPLFPVVAPAGIVLLTLFNVLAFGILNGGALLFPSWVRTEIRPGGIEAMGQHFLTAGVSVILLLLAAVGPAGIGFGFAYLTRPYLGNGAILPALMVSAGGLALEAFLLLDWLGTRFEHLDPSNLG